MKCLASMGVAMVAMMLRGQAPANAPAGSTGICRDGTYTSAAEKQGACGGHKGIQTWYLAGSAGAPSSLPAPTPATGAPSSMPAPIAASGAVAAMPAPTTGGRAASVSAPRQGPTAVAAAKPQASGGGHGLVWLNSGSNVYHCYGSEFYGRTKGGAYLSEADAKAKGAHGARNASCEGK